MTGSDHYSRLLIYGKSLVRESGCGLIQNWSRALGPVRYLGILKCIKFDGCQSLIQCLAIGLFIDSWRHLYLKFILHIVFIVFIAWSLAGYYWLLFTPSPISIWHDRNQASSTHTRDSYLRQELIPTQTRGTFWKLCRRQKSWAKISNYTTVLYWIRIVHDICITLNL